MKEKGSRCCIISGDASAESTASTTDTANKKNVPLFIDNYITKGKEYIIRKKESGNITNMAVFAGIVAVLCITLLFFTPAYDVYIDGHKIGSVPDKEYFSTVYDNVNYDIENIAGKYYTLNSAPAYVFRIIPKNMFTSLDSLTDNLMALSEGVVKGFVVYADGEKIASAATNDDITAALETVKSEYEGENPSILNNIEIKTEYVPGIFSTQELLSSLSRKISVQTVKTVTYSEPVIYATEEIPTDKLRLGSREVVRAGVSGSREVTAQLTYVNGTETEKTVMSSVEVTAPTAEIVNVGTREVTGEGTGSIITPFNGMVSSRYGSRWGRTHKGIDIAGKEGSPVKAADDGIVKTTVNRYDYGNMIILDHQNGMETYYAHLSSIDVNEGDIVEKGDIIGKVGNTGISTGPHLHFEVRVDGVPQNPDNYISD